MLRENGLHSILVTGGRGFIGSHVVRDLLARGIRVLVTSKSSKAGPRNSSNLPDDPRLTVLDITVSEMGNWSDRFQDVEAIIHLAAVTEIPFSIENPAETFEINLGGMVNVLETARKLPELRNLVLISSEQVYAMPPSYLPIDEKHPVGPSTPYALSKLQQEQLAQVYSKCYDLPITILRSGLLFGERQKDKGINNLIKRAITDQQIIIEGGSQTRDIYHVSNLVHAINLALAKEATGETYNIAGKFEIKVSELVEKIVGATKSKSEIVYAGYRKNEGPGTRMSLDVSKAERMLGYHPKVTFDEGLSRTVAWLSKNLDTYSDHPTIRLSE